MGIYASMAVAAFIGLVWQMKMANLAVAAMAPIGAVFTFIALVTGSAWGKPMWGTWWVWDARLTSELVLLFLYVGVIALWHAFDDRRLAAALELLRREGVSEKEFREAKNQLRGSYLLGLESPGGRMQSMGRGQLHLGQCMTPEETIAKIEAVTQADVNAVAERIFAAEPCLSVVGKNASVYLAR